jgi:hypothetical protein
MCSYASGSQRNKEKISRKGAKKAKIFLCAFA